MTGNAAPAARSRTIDEFLHEIRARWSAMTSRREVAPRAWFRGHRRRDWPLIPSLLREKRIRQWAADGRDPRVIERNLLADFLTQGGAEIPPHLSSWELVALMRHYELPTRLLDWTTSLSVALYFALAAPGAGDEPDTPCIWMLDPFALNRPPADGAPPAPGGRRIFDSVDLPPVDYRACLSGQARWPFRNPVALRMPMSNPRLRAQRGGFTFHGDALVAGEGEIRPLDAWCGEAVVQIAIDEPLAGSLRDWLALGGIDEYALFPELDVLSRTIARGRLAGG